MDRDDAGMEIPLFPLNLKYSVPFPMQTLVCEEMYYQKDIEYDW